MSTTYCPACKTFSGIIPRRSHSGRKLKPAHCSSHTDAFATCDVCSVRTPLIRTGGTFNSDPLTTEQFGGPWTRIPVGEALRTFGRRNEYVEEKKAHVCFECSVAARKAMQVAFDQCMTERTGLRAGVVLDQSAPNTAITPINERETVTTTVSIASASVLVSP